MCLSSLVVKQKIFANLSPSVIFHGKVVQLFGPLQHEPGESPCYAQLYILDTDMQTTIRFNNMNINPHMSMNQQQLMRTILESVQRVIHLHNPYVKEFKQILEIPQDQLANERIVISASSRPKLEHIQEFTMIKVI